MRRILLIASIILLHNLRCMNAWTNYRLIFKHMIVDYKNDEMITLHRAEVKKVNRTFSYIPWNYTLLKDIDNYNQTLQFYKHDAVSNRFKEFLRQMTSDYCGLFSEDYKNTDKFSEKMFGTLKNVILDIFFTGPNNYPRSCPIPAGTYYVNMHVDESKLPTYLMPAGRYKMQFLMSYHDIKILRTFVFFDLELYISKKQKDKIG